MNFEQMQESWLSQKLPAPDITSMQAKAQTQWNRQHRGALLRATGVTISFAAVISFLIWIYICLHAGRSLFFGGSLLFMSILMIVYAIVLWKGLAYKDLDFSDASNQYINHYIKKLLWRRKTITTFSWQYAVLLWLAFMCYCFDITRGGSMALRIGAPLCTTLYIVAVQLIVKHTRQRKQVIQVDQLIETLKQIQANMQHE